MCVDSVKTTDPHIIVTIVILFETLAIFFCVCYICCSQKERKRSETDSPPYSQSTLKLSADLHSAECGSLSVNFSVFTVVTQAALSRVKLDRGSVR